MSDLFKRADGQRWQKNHISPSKLDLWSKCSAAFWFRYVMGVRKPGKVWLPQGTAVHAGVEHLLNDLSAGVERDKEYYELCLLYTSPSPRDRTRSRMPSSA